MEDNVLLKCQNRGTNEERYYIDLNDESSSHTVIYDIKNTPKEQDFKITKNSTDGKPIQGVKFCL